MLKDIAIICDTRYVSAMTGDIISTVKYEELNTIEDVIISGNSLRIKNSTNKNNISKKDFTPEIQSGFRSMIRKPLNAPWCINVLNFNILILTKATGYSEDYRLTHTNK